METTVREYVNENMSGATIDRVEMGTLENGTIWLDIRWHDFFIEFVIYPQTKQAGVSFITNDTLPFTEHDRIFDNIQEAIIYIDEKLKSGQ